MARQRRLSRLRDAGGYLNVPPQKLKFFFFLKKKGLNEAIWCTIFHHVKHLTACLLGRFLPLEQDCQKSGGAMPPV